MVSKPNMAGTIVQTKPVTTLSLDEVDES